MPKRINISDEAVRLLESVPEMEPIIAEHGISYAFEFLLCKLLDREIPLTPQELKSLAAQERWKAQNKKK